VEQEKIAITTLPELEIDILNYARDHGRVTMSDIVRKTSANRNTLKQHFRNLTRKKLLSQHGVKKGTWYCQA
jgi:predicted transcriptional regulator